ncbi:hypothetical protein RDWZM_001171 [Blomia tropicalis]|uniref:Casein kinase II subunit beta n=1 Tax=Blomia tropicalis TaxID=40697 RepID=A0A9Q0RR39_BLOTA|nr:hypothetical protein RDWZM_001171 [Blomia tropicalis]
MSKKVTWIKRFCSLDGNEFLCEVDEDFIVDKFNLTGLEEQVPFYKKSLDIILNLIDNRTLDEMLSDSNDEDFNSNRSQYNCKIQILASAELLYGLIHARYILTDAGLQKMKEKYNQSQFGQCTRYYCEKSAMLPIGLRDEPRITPVRLYCPRCMDIYVPHLSISSKYISIDGAYFGTNFPHMFFMVYPEARPLKPSQQFVPSLYGFKIHSSAYEYQQNQSISAKKAKSCPMQRGSKGDANCNGDSTYKIQLSQIQSSTNEKVL